MGKFLDRLSEALLAVAIVFCIIACLTTQSHGAEPIGLDFAALDHQELPAAAQQTPKVEQLDFDVLARNLDTLDFAALMGPQPMQFVLDFGVLAQQPITEPMTPPTVAPLKKKKPVFYAYVDLKKCPPCIRLNGEYVTLSPEEKEKLDFELVFKDPPAWVESFPTIHYQVGKDWKQFNWSDHEPKQTETMLKEFQKVYHSSLAAYEKAQAEEHAAATAKYREGILSHYKGWKRAIAEQVYDVTSQKLEENPNISVDELREEVKQALALPPFLAMILAPLIEYILQMVLQWLRPKPPAKAAPARLWQPPGLIRPSFA